MEGNQSIEEYLGNHRGRATGDTPVDYQSSNISNKGITDFEMRNYAFKLRKYELIDKIIRIAKNSGKEIDEEAFQELMQELMIDKIIEKAKDSGKEVDEEALRNELNNKSIQELNNALERLENQKSKQEPSTNQQETKTTDEGREPGE